MRAQQTVQVQSFQGLNRRAALEVAPKESLYIGDNIDVTLGRSLVRRDGLRFVCDLDPRSVGLYAAAGVLRAAAPAGQGVPSAIVGAQTVVYDRLSGPPTRFTTGTVALTSGSGLVTLTGGVWPQDIAGLLLYIPAAGHAAQIASRVSDTVVQLTTNWSGGTFAATAFQLDGVATAYDADALVRVSAAEVYGSSETGTTPYIVVERWVDPLDHSKGSLFEHHYIESTIDGPARTRVVLPFNPGPALAKLNGRLWAGSAIGDIVHFSSIEFGARNWSALGDAGFIPLAQHALGRRGLVGLGVYNDLLAAVFPDSVQLWETAIDPQAIRFVRAMNGPGTEAFGSVANALGDLFYFTRGGFFNLHTQTVTGEIQAQDGLGAAIYDLTKNLQSEGAVALWSQARGSYICAFGQTLFVYQWSPQEKVADWTTWSIPVAVENIVELGGKLFIRAENKLYVFDANYDDGAVFDAQFHFAWGKERHTRKQWLYLEMVQDGEADVYFAYEPTMPTTYDGAPLRISGSTTGMDRIAVVVTSPMLAVRFKGNKPWRLDSFAVTFQQLAW